MGQYYNFPNLDVIFLVPSYNSAKGLNLSPQSFNVINYATLYNALNGLIYNPSSGKTYNYQTPLQSTTQQLLQIPSVKNQITAFGINQLTDLLSNGITNNIFGTDSEVGRNLGSIFSQGISSAGNTLADNIIKGQALSQGLGRNVGASVGGAAAGVAANYIGQGINALGGNSKLSRGIGAGVATGLGSLGGTMASNLAKGQSLFNGIKGMSSVNLVGLGGLVLGSALGAAFGPSKEYGGTYGGITKGMDTAYDLVQMGVGFIPGIGTGISGLMALNKGLSNVFGSTSGMCVCAGTKIFTASGDIINIEDLLLEQGIIGWDENSHSILPNTIAGIIEPRLKECLEIELKNGTILRCSIDHPILSNIKERAESHRINGKRIAYREWSFRRADELQVGNWVGLANNIDYWGTEEMPNAYLVGMLIGDGTYTYESSCKLWTADPSTWKYLEENNLAVLIKQYTPENSNDKYSTENRDYRIINGMLLVKDLGIAYQSGVNKTLPKNIGKYNKNSICKMIAGLYDTDGSFSVNEEKGDYKVTLYQSNLDLLENLKLILLKLGIFSIIYTRKASINKMSNGRIINSNISYRLEVADRNSIINFYKNIPLNIDYKKNNLERIYKLVLSKLDKDHCDLSGAKQYKIISIKSIGILTVYNLEASETHTYLANGIITHNTRQDAILGSAFMPAPVKWLNMAGAKTTDTFKNQSWQNQEKTTDFMQDSFGDLNDKFNKARKESGKTYGTFSRHAYNKAQGNLDFANRAWNQIMEMANLNVLQNIRSLDMTSINNQRYAQDIMGGFHPLYRGKQGMKIFNNTTNHNIGMRLLSAAALIDNKQMILSAQSGNKIFATNSRGDSYYLSPSALTSDEVNVTVPETFITANPDDVARGNALRWWKEHSNVYGEKGLEQVSPEFDLITLSPLLKPVVNRGFRWVFNKAGLLVKVPVLETSIINNLTSHVQGEEAVKMFKEYGGTPIPEGSINGEQLRKYVMEARERYGLIGNNNITDEEIAQALYKHSKELGGNTAAVNAQGEPLLLFRGDTQRYTLLKERMSPEELAKKSGTMDNSLGNLFLGEFPDSYRGVDRYIGTWRNFNGSPKLVGSGTGSKVVWDGKIASEIEGYPYLGPLAGGGYKLYSQPHRYGNIDVYKLPASMMESGVNDLNAFIVRTPQMRNASSEISVLNDDWMLQGAKDSHFMSKNYKYNPKTDSMENVKTGESLGEITTESAPESRIAMGDHYKELLKEAEQKQLGLLKSEANSPLRDEHSQYSYFALPNFNIRGAKHLLPYDLRIPRDWSNPNIYKAVTPYIIGGSTAATLYNKSK